MSRSATNGASSISMPFMMPVKVPLAVITCFGPPVAKNSYENTIVKSEVVTYHAVAAMVTSFHLESLMVDD